MTLKNKKNSRSDEAIAHTKDADGFQQESNTARASEGLGVGDVVGERYQLTHLIDQGGMGKVFAARHLGTGAKVALKTLLTEYLDNSQACQRFEMEARYTASLSHPNIINVFDYGRQGDVLYLVMEFIKGFTLRSLIKSTKGLDWRRLVGIFKQILMALAAAHESPHQLIHRDIKPSNILISKVVGQVDFVKVVDFGISNALVGNATATMSTVGSPHTMAPEQWEGRPVTPATDLYAVGCTAFITLSGSLPFEGGVIQMRLAHVSQPPPDLTPLVDEHVPEALVQWVSWLMQKQPSQRPQTARQALEALNAIDQGDARVNIPTYGHTPPPHSAVASLHSRVNLPRVTSSFVGRERELAQLDQLLKERTRLVTLHGAGGLGKTRLAIQWATDTTLQFPGGRYFCGLAEAQTLDSICVAMGQALNVPFRASETPLNTVGYALSGRGRSLVVLDNFEQIVNWGSSSVGVWLQMAPETVFVITSRQSLGLEGENILELKPLPTPQNKGQEAIKQSEAVRLFIDRAKQVNGNFALTHVNAQVIARLVEQLDGLPLAIEMAASRVRTLQPEKILSRLSDRFRLLRSSRKDISSRQATLLATLDWSWDLLLPYEKSAFTQCSVFKGSFSLEAAEEILELSAHQDAPWVMDILDSLVDKTSLRGVEKGRYNMLVSIHQYAADKLCQTTSEADRLGVRERHLAYFSHYGQREFIKRIDLNHKSFGELTAELDNLQEALDFAVESGRSQQAALCALALGQYFKRQGPLEVGLQHLCKVTGETPQVQGRLKRMEGDLHYYLGRTQQAQNALQEALDLARDMGDKHLESNALMRLGHVLIGQGQLEQAQHTLQGALHLAREIGDKRLEGNALVEQGHLLISQGHLQETLQSYQDALHLAREIGDKRLEGDAIVELGYVLRLQGEFAKAQHSFQSALALARELGSKSLEGNTLVELGYVMMVQSEFAQAQHAFQGVLRLARDMGDKRLENNTLLGLGHALKLQGELAQALHSFQGALALSRNSGDKGFQCHALLGLGDVLSESSEDAIQDMTPQARWSQALHHLDEAKALLDDSDLGPWIRLEYDGLRALVLAQQEHLEQATALFQNLVHQQDQLKLKSHTRLAKLMTRVEQALRRAGVTPHRTATLED